MSDCFHKHPYSYLFCSGIVNGIGDRFSQVAVLALLLELTDSGLAVGIVMGMRVLPYLVLSPIAGKLADVWDRRKIMIVTDVVRVPFALSFLFVQSVEDLWIIYVSMFVLACGEAIYQPVRKSSIGVIVDQQHYTKVNGLEQVVIGIVLVAGSVTGGVVAFFVGKDVAFALNACTFIAAALIIKHLVIKKEVNQDQPIMIKRPHLNRTFGPIVMFIVVIQSVSAMLDGFFNVLISYYGAETFSMADLGVGILYGALGIGLVISFFVSKKVTGNLLLIGIISVGLEGVLQIIASQAPTLWYIAITFTGISLIGGVGAACFDSIVMRRTPKSQQGEVFGVIESISNVVIGIAMFSAGWLLELFSPRIIGLVGGSAAIFVMFLFILVFTFSFSSKNLTEK
ncbi:MFS transporter [Halobacillus amylolyticus]|uniref:MFS transporter n=1 Tax=Halobacillus amylolyticus TaxID=2932259 RepID=A0ABY4HES8_9BACI|nr:MFS transporter [Halobacillus amylolyticus]UOR13051.1 MFS transporter [Halobacillus amylolyticus]